VKTNFSDDMNNLYHNDHNGEFTDLAGPAGFGPVSVPFLGFGVKFFDYDDDGWPDVFVANGHVNPQVNGHSFGVKYAERPLLFHNLRNGRLEEVGLHAGPDFLKPRVARGAALGDFLNNGRQDVLVSVLDGSPVLFRQRSTRQQHWLRVKTVGTLSNRDGLGARVEVTTGSLQQSAEVRTNSSFESASDPRLHFGLGPAAKGDSVVVHWPSGKVDTIGPEAADQQLVVEEGKGVVDRQAASRLTKPGLARTR
jgi:hypothetical protein